MEKKKILLCGVNYGKSYVPAIRASPDVELAGILSRGSPTSRDLASALGVPLFLETAALPGEIELACVAVGPDGAALSRDLLRRGIHVLAEHPMVREDAQSCIEAAKASGRVFHVNAHWADLPAPQEFIEAFRDRLGLEGTPLYTIATIMPRTAYSTLDLLGRALGRVELTRPELEIQAISPCDAVRVLLGEIPTILVAQTFAGEVDDGSAVILTNAITSVFRGGALTLVCESGPVVWISAALRRSADEPVWSTLGSARAPTGGEYVLSRQLANAGTLRRFVQQLNGGVGPLEQSESYLLDLCEANESVAEWLGTEFSLPA
jgi:thiazolinyl imide reductase